MRDFRTSERAAVLETDAARICSRDYERTVRRRVAKVVSPELPGVLVKACLKAKADRLEVEITGWSVPTFQVTRLHRLTLSLAADNRLDKEDAVFGSAETVPVSWPVR